MNTSLRIAAALAVILFTTLGAQARTHHSYHNTRYSHHGGGSCDGFQRCRCGTTAARLNGLPYDYNGLNLKKASTWYALPHTGFGVGAVAVYPHHVATIVGGSDCHAATVHDDAGVYQRNVCGATYVSASGGGFGGKQTTTVSAHGHRHARYREYAAAFETQPDRMSIH